MDDRTMTENEVTNKLEEFKIILNEKKLKDNLIYNEKDWFLKRFLYVAKFDLDKAAQKVVNYYKIQKNNPTLFKDLTPSDLNKNIDNLKELVRILPGKDKQGRAVIFVCCDWNPSKISCKEIFRYGFLLLEEISRSENVQKDGFVFLADYQHMSFRHILAISPAVLIQTVALFQGSFPIKLKQIHAVNEPRQFKLYFKFLCLFISEKMKNRFVLHGGDRDSLFKHFDKEVIPDCLGGDYKDDYLTKIFPKMLDNEEYYNELPNFGYK